MRGSRYISRKNLRIPYVRLLINCLSILSIVTGCSSRPVTSPAKDLYVMLDIDNTLVQRLNPNETTKIRELIRANQLVREVRFSVSSHDNPKFFRWYQRMLKYPALRAHQRLVITPKSKDELEIKEIILVRSAALSFVTHLLSLPGTTTKFLITSSNDDDRTRAVLKALGVSLDGIPFEQAVEFVSRADFRVLGETAYGPQPFKSPLALRKYFRAQQRPIPESAYIVAIDGTGHERFVRLNSAQDYQLIFPPFPLENGVPEALAKDITCFKECLSQLKTFLGLID